MNMPTIDSTPARSAGRPGPWRRRPRRARRCTVQQQRPRALHHGVDRQLVRARAQPRESVGAAGQLVPSRRSPPSVPRPRRSEGSGVGSSNPGQGRRQNASAPAGSCPAARQCSRGTGAGLASALAARRAAYSAQHLAEHQAALQPSSSTWWKVQTSRTSSSASRAIRASRISGGCRGRSPRAVLAQQPRRPVQLGPRKPGPVQVGHRHGGVAPHDLQRLGRRRPRRAAAQHGWRSTTRCQAAPSAARVATPVSRSCTCLR